MTLIAEFAVSDPSDCPVATATEVADAPVTSVSRASTASGGSVPEEFAISSDAADGVSDVDGLEAVGDAESARVYRFDRDPSEACVCERIEELAGPASDVRAENGTLVVTTRVADLETVRDVVDSLREAFDSVSVRRLTDMAETTAGERAVAADEELTARQREVLRTAYEMGYFEYPKGANAGEVAEALDISRSTLAEHLAAAEGKVLASLVDAEDRVTA